MLNSEQNVEECEPVRHSGSPIGNRHKKRKIVAMPYVTKNFSHFYAAITIAWKLILEIITSLLCPDHYDVLDGSF